MILSIFCIETAGHVLALLALLASNPSLVNILAATVALYWHASDLRPCKNSTFQSPNIVYTTSLPSACPSPTRESIFSRFDWQFLGRVSRIPSFHVPVQLMISPTMCSQSRPYPMYMRLSSAFFAMLGTLEDITVWAALWKFSGRRIWSFQSITR